MYHAQKCQDLAKMELMPQPVIRPARSITKRDHIAFCGYHGWHDWFIATTDLNSGIPKFNNKLAHQFTYNNLDSLERIFKKYKNKIAIVIMEP